MNIICITLIIITALIAIVIINTNNMSYKKSIGVPEKCMSMDDSIIQAKQIGRFLSDRYEGIGYYALKMVDKGLDSQSIDRIISGKEQAVIDLIRMCHGCGCEITIRQTHTRDIENTETETEYVAGS